MFSCLVLALLLKNSLCKFVAKLCSEVFSLYTTLSSTWVFDCVYKCRELLATFLQFQPKSTEIEIAWKAIFIMNIPVCCVSPKVSNWNITLNLILSLNWGRNRVVTELNPWGGTFELILVHEKRKAQLNFPHSVAFSPSVLIISRNLAKSWIVKISKIVGFREAFCNNVLSQGHETCNERQIVLLFSKLSLGGDIWLTAEFPPIEKFLANSWTSYDVPLMCAV